MLEKTPRTITEVGTMNYPNSGGFYLTHIHKDEKMMMITNLDMLMRLTRYLDEESSYNCEFGLPSNNFKNTIKT